jgi:hypothetical protein
MTTSARGFTVQPFHPVGANRPNGTHGGPRLRGIVATLGDFDYAVARYVERAPLRVNGAHIRQDCVQGSVTGLDGNKGKTMTGGLRQVSE